MSSSRGYFGNEIFWSPGRDQEFWEPTLRQHRLVRSEDLSGGLQGESEGFQSTETNSTRISEPPGIGKPFRGAEPNVEQVGAEALKDFWSIQGDLIYRHHIEPRVQLYVPKEETVPIPLKYLDVTRSAFINLDVSQEKRKDDCWNVNVNCSLSDSWTGFTRFTLLKEKPLQRYSWSRGRLTKSQATTRPEHVWPEVWTKIGKSRSEKRKARVGKRQAKTRPCSETERYLFYRSGRLVITMIREKKAGTGNALQERSEKSSKLIGNGSERWRIPQDFKDKTCLYC